MEDINFNPYIWKVLECISSGTTISIPALNKLSEVLVQLLSNILNRYYNNGSLQETIIDIFSGNSDDQIASQFVLDASLKVTEFNTHIEINEY
jgi:hypothetical protein